MNKLKSNKRIIKDKKLLVDINKQNLIENRILTNTYTYFYFLFQLSSKQIQIIITYLISYSHHSFFFIYQKYSFLFRPYY